MASGKGVQRAGVVVIIPTTAGAIQVMGLRWQQRISQCRVVLGNETSNPCERWTKDYHSLLSPADPMRVLLGLPEAGGSRLVVSAEIDHGRSWIVPVAAAHFADARAQAVHADTSRARLMIWGTGAIDFSQPETADEARIVENDYHLTTKIDLSRAHFASAAHDGTPVLCLLPAGTDAERAATVLRKVLGQQPHHIAIVSSLADIIRPIEAFLAKGDFNAPPDLKYAPVPYTPPPETEEEAAPPPPVGKAADAPKATADAPPIYGLKTPPPVAPATAAAAAATGSAKGLSMGVLGGIAAALVAVIGVGAMMLRPGPAPAPPQVQAPVTPPVPPRPQVVSIPAQPPVTSPAAPTPASPTTPPMVVSPPVTVAPPATLPVTLATPPATPSATSPAAPAPATGDPAVPVGRLTVLTPPAGSSCQAQAMEMNARYVETVVELGGGQPVLEIDSPAICGLAIAGSGAVQARFAPGTVAGTVASLSSAGRIIFNPSNTSARLPEIAVTGGPLEKIELRRK